MRRNILGIALCAMLFAVCSPAQAQQSKTSSRIGFLMPGSRATYAVRIEAFQNGLRELGFSYRDRKDQNRKKTMTLDAHEFIRRFLLHVIPKGFVRVRHFGFLANRSKSLLSKCRKLLDLDPTVPKLSHRSVHDMMLQLTGIDITRCPLCQKGTLVFLANLPVPAPWDSS